MRVVWLRRPTPGRWGTTVPVYWFDLDNTLHNSSLHILPEIDRQMTQYLVKHLHFDAKTADHLRLHYWQRYGATLLGLMRHHKVNPHHFLHHTHTLHPRLTPLRKHTHRHGNVPHGLAKTPGIRVLLTNAPRAYATQLCKEIGLHRHFHAMVCIEDMVVHGRWQPKPAPLLWAGLRRAFKATQPILFEDTRSHMRAAARQGITGVWVRKPGGWVPPSTVNHRGYRPTR